MSLNQHAISFEPVVRVGETVKIIKGKSDDDVIAIGKVKFIEALPEKKHDFGALAANTAVEDAEITDLYLNEGEFAQYRIFPLDDIEVTVKQPASKTRFSAKAYSHRITALTNQLAPNMPQIFIFEDEKVAFTVKNPSYQGRSMNRVLFSGYRYVLDMIWKKGTAGMPLTQAPATVVEVEGA